MLEDLTNVNHSNEVAYGPGFRPRTSQMFNISGDLQTQATIEEVKTMKQWKHTEDARHTGLTNDVLLTSRRGRTTQMTSCA